MTHIEDSIIYGGVSGTRQAILALRSLRDMLKGEHTGDLSVKWDGAPAIFAGIDPTDGKFFVAKKGIFNKNPKVYKTKADVDADTSGDLADKLNLALQYLPELGIKGVIQGDFLYGPGDVKKETISGDKYVTFHPNTLVYAVPSDSESAQSIIKSKIGIVWHTTYSGDSFENMRASYGVDVSKLKPSKNVWSQDAMLRDFSAYTLNGKETQEVNKLISVASIGFKRVGRSFFTELAKNKQIATLIETHHNSYIRSGKRIPKPMMKAKDLVAFVSEKADKAIDKLKSEAGKEKAKSNWDPIIEFFSSNQKQLAAMFEMHDAIVDAKNILIQKLNMLQKTKSFVKTRSGFKVAGAEGYVAIDKMTGGAVKVVDRFEFSANNFSPDIIKGWESDRRN